jgi:hypothetical protein
MFKTKDQNTDWRLTNQESYLMGTTLRLKAYSERTTETDHDHCEFSFEKFTASGEDTLHEGYATIDDQRWICRTCFDDFKVPFKFHFEN